MAKLTTRTELAEAPATGDLIHIVDVSDTTDNAAGTSKKISASNLRSGLTTTNLSAATLVTEAEGITANDNDTTLPSSAAVKDYVDTAIVAGGGYTDENAQDAVGAMVVDTATIDITYTDATPELKADVKDDSITYAKMQNVSATDRLLGRDTAGAGDVEEIAPSAVKTMLSLDNVNNTSDANKPISTATQSALDAKQNSDQDLTDIAALSPSNDDLLQRKAGAWANRTPAQVKTDLALTKSDVDLANVDNTSDANKPISTATQTALDAKAADNAVVKLTGDQTVAGVKTFSSDPLIPDEAYDATAWNGSLEPPTKNAIRDKLESLSAGGQTLVTHIVAASGGTHTTLGAAIAAAANGDTIYVREGTYTESAITSALTNLTIIGEGRAASVIDLVATTCTLSGANITIKDLSFTMTTGSLLLSGSRSTMHNVDWNRTSTSTANAGFVGSGTQSQYTDCFFTSANANSTARSDIEFSGANQIINNNHFLVVPAGSTSGQIKVSGNFCQINNNWFNEQASGTGNMLELSADRVSCNSNTFQDANRSMTAIYSTNYNQTINNNYFITVLRGIDITSGMQYINASGNTCSSSGNGIRCSGNHCAVNGNMFQGAGTGTGIEIAGNENSITGNRCKGFSAEGLKVTSGSNNLVSNNQIEGNGTTEFTDSGTNTTVLANITTDQTIQDKRFVQMTNTSGATIAQGAVVTLKSVASGVEVTTTTTGGDSKVHGVATASIINNGVGTIQVEGKTTLLKVNGTTDIAIGDFLSTFTTAGIAKKASAAETAFAIALEAYALDDSSGVIDALIIPPRLM